MPIPQGQRNLLCHRFTPLVPIPPTKRLGHQNSISSPHKNSTMLEKGEGLIGETFRVPVQCFQSHFNATTKHPKATAENWQEINKSAELDLDGEDENAADDAQQIVDDHVAAFLLINYLVNSLEDNLFLGKEDANGQVSCLILDDIGKIKEQGLKDLFMEIETRRALYSTTIFNKKTLELWSLDVAYYRTLDDCKSVIWHLDLDIAVLIC
ncbi:hypothetical protein ACJX0J_013470 [Zea mays]